MVDYRTLIGALAYLIVVIMGIIIFLQGRKSEKRKYIDQNSKQVD